MLQELLGAHQATIEELSSLNVSQLNELIEQLKRELRARGV